jgi:glycerol-3-phosphate O-acyltransferase
VLAAHNPHWREETVLPEERPAWLVDAVWNLSRGIVRNINAAAVAGPVNLVSLALLATPRHAMDEDQLIHQLDAYRKLAALAPYSGRVEVTGMDGKAMVAWCEQLRLLQRQSHPLGDVLYFTQEDAVLSTYARNNVLHVFALPALLACLATRNANLKRVDVMRLVQTVYPFLRNELFLRWETEELEQAVAAAINALVEMQWLRKTGDDNFATPHLNSDGYVELSLLAQAMRPTLIRYFITIAMLTQRGSGTIDSAELESLCHLQAQRLSLLREFNAPEFFDKAIFRSFIDTLKQTGYAQVSEDGMIHYDAQLVVAANEARFVLPPDVRQTVLHMTRVGIRR